MKIIKLEAENVKRLRAVSIRPDGAMVTVGGMNGQGKTSLLDAISYALGGKELLPPKVIREGQTKAKVVLELDTIVVERRWTPGGTYLEVRNKDGAKFGSPQAMLDKLVGTLSFDPLGFTRLKPKDQAETLRKVAGVDFTPLDAQRKALYDQRTDVHREIGRLEGALRTMPKGSDLPVPDTQELLDRQQKLIDAHGARESLRIAASTANAEATRQGQVVIQHRDRIQRLERELAEAKTSLDAALVAAEKQIALTEQLAERYRTTPDVQAELQAIRVQLADSAEAQRARRDFEAHQKTWEAAMKHRSHMERLSVEIAEVDQMKQEMLTEANLPVAGLAFTEEGVTLNGIPFEQASGAEQLRVSVAMGLALNPQLKVLLVRDGSLLDANSLAMMGEMAEKAGAQVWLEVVGDRQDVSVVISDGSASGPAAEAPQEASATP